MNRAFITGRPTALACLALGAALLDACATTGTGATAAQPPVTEAARDTPASAQTPLNASEPVERAEQLWRRRTDAKDIATSIEAFHALAEATPDAIHPWLRIAEGHYLLGRLHEVEQPDPAAAIEAFTLGLNAAREAKARATHADEAAQLRASYWEAVNLLEWTSISGFIERVDHEQELLRLLAELKTQKPVAHDAARALAALLAMPASLDNRDLAQSKALFESLVADDPWDLHARVAFASTYAVAAQDRDVFERQLREIVERTSSNRGDAVERRLAARMASRLLRDAPSLFE